MKLNVLSSKMTGHFAAVALYDTSVPVKVRKEILNYLIDVWKEAVELFVFVHLAKMI